MRGRIRTSENIYVVVIALLGLGVVVITDKMGMPQKWHAVIVGTLISFGGVAWVFRPRWPQRKFWLALVLCFGLHALAMWVIFTQVFGDTKTFGILLWTPAAFIEGVILLGILPALERRL